MSNSATEAVASFFHNQRKKRRKVEGVDKIVEAMKKRLADEALVDRGGETE